MNNNIENLYDAPIPEHARGFFDPIKTREWLKEKAIDSFKEHLNKVETGEYKLRVKDIKFPDPNKRFSYKDQKDAIFNRKDLSIPLTGTFELVHKGTGNVVDTKKATIAQIPYITDRNTLLVNGNEYLLTNQQRLKPGVYSRLKATGELEAHVNVKAGSGFGGKLIFDPTKAIFNYQVGTTQIKLYGLLKDLGISDAEMEKAWGKEIFQKNKAASDGKELEKFYNKIFSFE